MDDCVKCGSKDIATQHCMISSNFKITSGAAFKWCFSNPPLYHKEEVLHRKCRTCGYGWNKEII